MPSGVQVRVLSLVPMDDDLKAIREKIERRQKEEFKKKKEWDLNPLSCVWEWFLEDNYVDEDLRRWMVNKIANPAFKVEDLSLTEFGLFVRIFEDNMGMYSNWQREPPQKR